MRVLYSHMERERSKKSKNAVWLQLVMYLDAIERPKRF